MTSVKKRIAAVLAAGASVAGLAVVAAPAASAAPTAAAASYNGACGSGYTVVNSAAVGTSGTIFLTYSSATGDNCVVTVRNAPGATINMYAGIAIHNGLIKYDNGQYTTYAGPVYLSAAGKCVDWIGVIGSDSGGKNGTNCG
ncbi:spore-associated protein A [Streptomyces fuscigenes]|uniref:spore-associated protein A n=1 Tax=Streptomyces fuscigenes TaxID=1528880 RepID=UPI001F3719C0|nr:spore-associated protein A [Streptomyces fuscigenes]MCF3961734.1 spore-associated protein A [Streptomyces fuscigenes]